MSTKFRRLEYQHDYFGDIEIAKSKKAIYFPLNIHAENVSLSIAPYNELLFWKVTRDIPVFKNLNFEITAGKLFGIIGPDGNFLFPLIFFLFLFSAISCLFAARFLLYINFLHYFKFSGGIFFISSHTRTQYSRSEQKCAQQCSCLFLCVQWLSFHSWWKYLFQ